VSLALPTRTTRSLAAGGALALVLGLTGCGAGLRAQTYQERATSDSTNEAIGAINVRHLRVLPPGTGGTYAVGSDARVGVELVNEGNEDDRLTSVTSDLARSVQVVRNGVAASSLVVPAQGRVADYGFVLQGLTKELRPGNYVRMELTFEQNGSASMLVPVEVTGTPDPRPSGYKAGETDSNGGTLPEGPSGADQPEQTSDPIGDENAGTSNVTPPPAR
jgi:copper(I)-binding protein